MNKVLSIILISLFSLTIISCAKKSSDDSSSSGSTTSSGTTTNPIQLSDVKANLSGKNLFITTASSGSSSGRSSKSAYTSTTSDDNTSTTSTKSLITIDNNSVIDYGIISEYELEIEQVVTDPSNTYSYILMKYNGLNSNLSADLNIRALNCSIFRVNLENNEMTCIEKGMVVLGIKDNINNTRDIYAKPVLDFSDNGKFFFMTLSTGDLSPEEDLKCHKYCLYEHDPVSSTTTKLNKDLELEVSRFLVLGDGQVVYTGWKLENGELDLNNSVHSEILLRDENQNVIELSSYEGNGYNEDLNAGDYKTVIFGSESKEIVMARSISGTVKKTYIESGEKWGAGGVSAIIKSSSGKIYAQVRNGLFSILPYKIDSSVSTPDEVKNNFSNTEMCGDSMTCFIFYEIIDDIVIYNHINYNYTNKPTTIKATRISDNKTISLVEPDSNCTTNCYSVDSILATDNVGWKPKWYSNGNDFYISANNLSTNENELIKIQLDKIDFNGSSNQYNLMNDLDDYMSNKSAKDISGLNVVNINAPTPTAQIKHEDNDNISVRIEFNNKMNYSDVESKVSIIDNSSNSGVGFMPIWNNKTLHLVVDTDNGTSSTVESNPLTSGTTYKVSLLGTAKDSDGNTLGSDLVKYITP